MSVKILDVGSGSESVAAQVFDWIEDKDITRLDIDPALSPDILHDITCPLPDELRGAYDIVFVSHVLEHIDRTHVIDTFRNVAGAVRNMGEVWILVPSLEWAAGEILARREGLGVQGAIFGGQANEWDFHRTGFTLAALRQMVEICGLIIRKAYQSPFKIRFQEKEFGALQNIVIAVRYDGLNGDPAEAISVNAAE